MPKELKRNVLSEQMKGSILAVLIEGYSERQVASILKISKTAVHKHKVKLQTSCRSHAKLEKSLYH